MFIAQIRLALCPDLTKLQLLPRMDHLSQTRKLPIHHSKRASFDDNRSRRNGATGTRELDTGTLRQIVDQHQAGLRKPEPAVLSSHAPNAALREAAGPPPHVQGVFMFHDIQPAPQEQIPGKQTIGDLDVELAISRPAQKIEKHQRPACGIKWCNGRGVCSLDPSESGKSSLTESTKICAGCAKKLLTGQKPHSDFLVTLGECSKQRCDERAVAIVELVQTLQVCPTDLEPYIKDWARVGRWLDVTNERVQILMKQYKIQGNDSGSLIDATEALSLAAPLAYDPTQMMYPPQGNSPSTLANRSLSSSLGYSNRLLFRLLEVSKLDSAKPSTQAMACHPRMRSVDLVLLQDQSYMEVIFHKA